MKLAAGGGRLLTRLMDEVSLLARGWQYWAVHATLSRLNN